MEILFLQLYIAFCHSYSMGTQGNLTCGVCDCSVSSVMELCRGMTRSCESQHASRGSHNQLLWMTKHGFNALSFNAVKGKA